MNKYTHTHTHVDTHIYSHIHKYIYVYSLYIYIYTYTHAHSHGMAQWILCWRDCRPRTKPCVRGRQTKKGRRGNATDLGIVEWRIPVGRAERTNRGPGGREGDAGTDRIIDEGGEDENDGEREKNRRAEKRNREERGKDEGRIYPDRAHSEIKSKHVNFNSKNPPDPLL